MTEQLPLHGIAVYNPGILSDEELKRYFVARLPLLEHLLDGLRREEPGKTPQHRLIVGTRGMGKTTLLHRLALAIEEDGDLSQAWLPLNFPEEQYNIARLSDLWVNCLDALADTLEQAGKEALFSELDRTIDNLPDEERKRAEAALENLLGFAERLGKRLLLLIDNLDIVLDRLSDDHWTIRKVLGHEPRLLLIGASARVLEATYEYEAAFYDFFKLHELKGLDEAEMRQVLVRLAEADDNPAIARMIEDEPARLRTLHTLTGGNPRTAVLLYGVLAQGMEGDVRSDLERLLDHCTPLYKSRFEELSPQAQKIVDAMAVFWDPLTAGVLAEQVRLPVNSVSTQLTRLEQQGVVEKVAIRPGRKTGFQIAERFFNIWYLMRTSRRVRRRLVWLVQFLRVFYSQEELHQRAQRHLLAKGIAEETSAGLRHAEYAFSLARALEDDTLRSALECSALQSMSGDRKLRKELKSLLDLEGEDAPLKPLAERMTLMKELPERIRTASREWPEGFDIDHFSDLLVHSFSLTPELKAQVVEKLLKINPDALGKLKEILEKESAHWARLFLADSRLIDALKRAIASGLVTNVSDSDGLHNAATTLALPILEPFAKLQDLEKAPAKLADGELSDLKNEIQAFHLEFAWNDLGVTLREQGDLPGAIEAYRKQLEVKPDHEAAWYNLGNALGQQGDLPGAIEAYRKQLEVKPDHEAAWYNLGIALGQQGDLSGAIEAYRKQLEVKPDDEWAWYNLGIALGQQGDLAGAIEAYRKQLEVKPDHEWAWNNLGNALGKQDNLPGAIEAYRKQLEVKPDDEWAWNNLGNALADQDDLPGAIEAYRQGIEHDDGEGHCHNALAWLYFEQNDQLEEAESLARQAVTLSPENLDHHHTLAFLLVRNGKWTEARQEALQFLRTDDGDWLDRVWDDILRFFKEALQQDFAEESVQLLEEAGLSDRWRPLHTALKAFAVGDDWLTRVAPEVRQPAEALMAMLRPEGGPD